ncbi:hypothetical protein [Spirillospora sp. NPDC029432]|uniref:hypothetical protein n=1 Tax=Spirillospora sp. NPDC029432 TaxID=3154599 RepID=UPI003454308C
MNLIGIGRAFAVLISGSTFAFLFVHDSWRDDNLFLVPDLILCVLLLVSAALPARYAAPAVAFALAMCTGVFTASVSSYAVRGEFGGASLLGVIGCAVVAALLQRHLLVQGRPR